MKMGNKQKFFPLNEEDFLDNSLSSTIPLSSNSTEKDEFIPNIPKNSFSNLQNTLDSNSENSVRLCLIGIGGAGCNILYNLYQTLSGIFNHCEFLAVNTDATSLQKFKNTNVTTLQLGPTGLGAGSNPAVARKYAEENQEIDDLIKGYNIFIICTGFGGGTGTGATEEFVKRIKKQGNVLVFVIATTPFLFEGAKRTLITRQAIKELMPHADLIIPLANQAIYKVSATGTQMLTAFKKMDDMCALVIGALVNSITNDGIINADYSDLAKIVNNENKSCLGSLGIGYGVGPEGAIKAVTEALNPPLLDTNFVETSKECNGVLLCISGSDLKLTDFDSIMTCVSEKYGDTQLISGVGPFKLAPFEEEILTRENYKEPFTDVIRVLVLIAGLTYKEKPSQNPKESSKFNIFDYISGNSNSKSN